MFFLFFFFAGRFIEQSSRLHFVFERVLRVETSRWSWSVEVWRNSEDSLFTSKSLFGEFVSW